MRYAAFLHRRSSPRSFPGCAVHALRPPGRAPPHQPATSARRA